MISSETEYQKACEEIEHLTRWLAQLETAKETEFKGLTAGSIRKMISRIHEEIAEYDAAKISTPPASKDSTEPKNTGSKQQTGDHD